MALWTRIHFFVHVKNSSLEWLASINDSIWRLIRWQNSPSPPGKSFLGWFLVCFLFSAETWVAIYSGEKAAKRLAWLLCNQTRLEPCWWWGNTNFCLMKAIEVHYFNPFKPFVCHSQSVTLAWITFNPQKISFSSLPVQCSRMQKTCKHSSNNFIMIIISVHCSYYLFIHCSYSHAEDDVNVVGLSVAAL